MTVTSPGKQLCFLWSGRNHADNGETCDGAPNVNGINCPVYIHFSPRSNEDPSQLEMKQNVVAVLDFSDCSRQAKYNNADRPCGGCFTVPQRTPGVYTVQWRWALNMQGQFPETYATCIDVQVEAVSSPSVEVRVTTAVSGKTSSSAAVLETSMEQTVLDETTKGYSDTLSVITNNDSSGDVRDQTAAGSIRMISTFFLAVVLYQ